MGALEASAAVPAFGSLRLTEDAAFWSYVRAGDRLLLASRVGDQRRGPPGPCLQLAPGARRERTSSRLTCEPLLGRHFEAMDPLGWLARMSDHIPDPGQHRTLFYGEYANRVRGERHPPEAEECSVAVEPPRKRCSPSWARLIAKVYQVDPLLCTRCGQRMSIVAFLTDAFAIRKILDHLALSTPEAERPPPQREVLPVAEHGEGWGVPAEWE